MAQGGRATLERRTMKTVNIGLIGCGTIGQGVINAILQNGDIITERTGVHLVLKGVCDKREAVLKKLKSKKILMKTIRPLDLINDDEVDIIVELIGGINPAKEIVLSAINKKKHIVTANKALLSECSDEIFKAASNNNVFVNFEGSVGGALPIIRAMKESFVANNFEVIYGILNGTTNFILTQMKDKGCSFKDALKTAQKLGIAEADPELDISGKDSAHKLSILSLLGYGVKVSWQDIYTEGIENIREQDIEFANKLGYNIKLLAIAKKTEEGLELRVHPTLIQSSHLLSNVKGADNAIFVKGDFLDESLIYGKGAGQKPTASSVVGDIVDIAKHVAFYGDGNPMPHNIEYAEGGVRLSKIENLEMNFYLRFSVIDKPGVLAGISTVLAENKISIASVSQEERDEGQTVPVIILTHKAKEGDMRKAIGHIDTQKYVTDNTVVIRMEHEK